MCRHASVSLHKQMLEIHSGQYNGRTSLDCILTNRTLLLEKRVTLQRTYAVGLNQQETNAYISTSRASLYDVMKLCTDLLELMYSLVSCKVRYCVV